MLSFQNHRQRRPFHQGLRLIVLGAVACCASCHRQPSVRMPSSLSPERLQGSAVMREVESFVALGPRVAGTDGARKAADYIAHRLGQLGLAPETDEFLEVTSSGTNVFRNVVARLPGGEDRILLLAHYDTKGAIGDRFVGANDSGSGVGVLLALAAVLRPAAGATRVGPAVWLVFLDGEECRVSYGPADGLHGSRHLAARLRASGEAGRVRAVILLDMIGDRDLRVSIPRNGSPELTSLVFSAATAQGCRTNFALLPGAILDDHQPFLDAGMPAVDLIDFEYGSRPGLNDYWHTERDTLDKLSPDSLETVGRVVMRTINALGP